MFSRTDVFRLILGVILITLAFSRGYGSHTTYPGTTGISGNQSFNGAKTHNTHVNHKETVIHNTHVEHHHRYSPPSHVTYDEVAHPAYVGSHPTYIYQYRESGSRFDKLLTGLALYNLGRISAKSNNIHLASYKPKYKDEVCKLRIETTGNDGFEETRVPCEAMSSFLFEDEERTQASSGHMEGVEEVVDALQAKGPSIQVSPDMTCYMIYIYGGSTKNKWPVDCGLLEAYTESSFRNSAGTNVPMHPIAILLVVISFS